VASLVVAEDEVARPAGRREQQSVGDVGDGVGLVGPMVTNWLAVQQAVQPSQGTSASPSSRSAAVIVVSHVENGPASSSGSAADVMPFIVLAYVQLSGCTKLGDDAHRGHRL
jgi:hypothetical protein